MARQHDDDFQGSYFSLEIDGVKLAYFTACSGISIEFEPVKFKQIGKEGTMAVETKRPGRPKYAEITLKRGFTADKALYEWFDKVVASKEDTPYKTGSIVIYSRTQKPVARYNLQECWPSKLSVSDLSAGSDEVMVEELTIQHEALDWA